MAIHNILGKAGEDAAAKYLEHHLSKDKSYANEIINKCRKRADEYDIRFMAEKYNKVYKRIVEKSLYDNNL